MELLMPSCACTGSRGSASAMPRSSLIRSRDIRCVRMYFLGGGMGTDGEQVAAVVAVAERAADLLKGKVG